MSRKPSLVNVDAEKTLIGALIRSPDSYWQISEQVRPDQFSVAIHREIFTAIAGIVEEGKKLSIPLMTSRLPEEDDQGQPMTAVLAALSHNAEGLAAADFAERVSELAARRRLARIAEEITKAVNADDKLAIEAAQEAEAGLVDVMQYAAPRRPRRIDDLAKEVKHASAKAFKSKGAEGLPGLLTGLHAVDEITGVVMPGDFIVVIGAQGDGKSSLLQQIGTHMALSGPVLALHNEMSGLQVATRELAAESRLSVRMIREGAFDFSGYEAIEEAHKRLEGLPFYVYFDPKFSMRRVRSLALAMKRTIGLVAITVDQLTHVRSEHRMKDKFERYEHVTEESKEIAAEIGCSLWLAAQRTRRSQRREDPDPQIDDTDASSIERDADMVLAVTREENWIRRNKPSGKGQAAMDDWRVKLNEAKGRAKVFGLKVRSGPADLERELEWDGPRTRFRDVQ